MKKEFYDALIQLTEEKKCANRRTVEKPCDVPCRRSSGLLCITGECRRSTEDYSLMQRGRNAILYFRKWK